ncbi:hypothetical protein [Sphingobacterium sp. UDSM-2020]|uniref:hypothetical protein n=1 Tax=Sphingobacterium sp. UDSM-2020 TaxID=2795738 RepID=UPI001938B5C8|nr:hypothetical protein [Sphingobacterium sp. UDSM-2020]QQD12315.1 hypothetical protein JAZ75_17110 [Sphingobacterium sp. UDSM-2020]
MKKMNAPLFVHLCFMIMTFYALFTDRDWLLYFTENLNFNLVIFGIQAAGLIYAGYVQGQNNKRILSIFLPGLIGLVILVSCILITGGYQFNKNIDISFLWGTIEAYYIFYDVLIYKILNKAPSVTHFQAQCIYIILSSTLPLIGYIIFQLKRNSARK